MELVLEIKHKNGRYHFELGSYGSKELQSDREKLSEFLGTFFTQANVTAAMCLAFGDYIDHSSFCIPEDIIIVSSDIKRNEIDSVSITVFSVEMLIKDAKNSAIFLRYIFERSASFLVFSEEIMCQFTTKHSLYKQFFSYKEPLGWAIWLEEFDGYPSLNGFLTSASFRDHFITIANKWALENKLKLKTVFHN